MEQWPWTQNRLNKINFNVYFLVEMSHNRAVDFIASSLEINSINVHYSCIDAFKSKSREYGGWPDPAANGITVNSKSVSNRMYKCIDTRHSTPTSTEHNERWCNLSDRSCAADVRNGSETIFLKPKRARRVCAIVLTCLPGQFANGKWHISSIRMRQIVNSLVSEFEWVRSVWRVGCKLSVVRTARSN